MKKILACFLALTLFFTGTGAKKSTPEKQVTKVVEQFYGEIQKGDFEKAKEYLENDSVINFPGVASELESGLDDYKMNDEQKKRVQQAANDLMAHYMKVGIAEYKVDKVRFKEGKKDAKAIVTITGADPNELNTILNDTSDIEQQLVEKYQDQIAAATDDTKKAEVMTNVLVDTFGLLSQKLDGFEQKESQDELKLKKKDGKWIITGYNGSTMS